MDINYNVQLRVAAVQAEPVWFDGDATVDKAVRIIEEAAKNGAKLVAFPECFVSGYPLWIHVNNNITEARFYKGMYASAMSLGDERMRCLMKAARDNNIYVVMGYNEFGESSLYMSQVFIGDTGEILANRRKLKPSHKERCIYGEGDGSDMLVVKTPIGIIGGLNCWEHFQPLEIYTMAALHEQIHVASWPSHNLFDKTFADSDLPNIMATSIYAATTQTFTLAATITRSEKMQEAYGCDELQKEWLPVGGGWSRIFAPDGSDLTEDQHIPEDQEGIVYADIDLMDILQAKVYRDPVGQYSRPDIFTLHVNGKHNRHMIIHNDGERRADTEVLFAMNQDFLRGEGVELD